MLHRLGPILREEHQRDGVLDRSGAWQLRLLLTEKLYQTEGVLWLGCIRN